MKFRYEPGDEVGIGGGTRTVHAVVVQDNGATVMVNNAIDDMAPPGGQVFTVDRSRVHPSVENAIPYTGKRAQGPGGGQVMSDENKTGMAALVGLGVIGAAALVTHFFGKSAAFGAAKTNPYWGLGGSKKGYPTPRGDESYPPYVEHLATAPIEYTPGTYLTLDPLIGAERARRRAAKDPTRDAYGRGVKRGDSPSPMPAADRWKLWKAMGLLPQIVPQGGSDWKAWRARNAPSDNPTPSPLPGAMKFGAFNTSVQLPARLERFYKEIPIESVAIGHNMIIVVERQGSVVRDWAYDKAAGWAQVGGVRNT